MTRTATLALAVVLVVAGCAGDDDEVPVGTTSTTFATTSSTSTTSTSAETDVEALATERYLAYWDARFAANEAPAANPDAPALRELATGAQLDSVIAETTRNRDEGIAFRRPESSVAERRVQIISIDPDVVRLQDCATTDGIVYRVDSGEVIDDSVVTHSIEATMRLVDGEWKLESAQLLQSWDGVAGCALAE
jgi:hypothetical protein